MAYYDRYRYLRTLNAVDDEDNWWVAGYEVNGIFRVRKQNKDICFLKKQEKSNYPNRRYQYTFKNKSKIYFFPIYSSNIEVYDMESESFFVIKIYNDSSRAYGAIGYVVNGKYIYLISGYCNEIPVRINTNTMVCERIFNGWKNIVNKYANDKKWFICNVAEVDGHIWYGVYKTNVLIKSSIQDLQDINVIYLDEMYKIYRVKYIEENRLLVNMVDGKDSIIYNIADGVVETKISVEEIGVIVNVLSYEKEIVFIPEYGKKIMLVNCDTGTRRIIDCSSEKLRCFCDMDKCFYYGKIDEDKIYLYPYNTNMLTIIDRKDMSISYEEWEIEKGASSKDIMKKYVIDYDEVIHYEGRCSLEIFLEDMIDDGQQMKQSEDTGTKIHEEIVKQL